MAYVTTTSKPVMRWTTSREVTKVHLNLTRAEADVLLDNLRDYWDGRGYEWDGPIMTLLARSLGRSRPGSIDFR